MIKISQLVFMMLMIGIIFFSFTAMVDDFESQYVDTGISPVEPLNETYRQAFVDAQEINETFKDVINAVPMGAGEEDFTILEGLVALPKIAWELPAAFFNFLGLVKESLFTMFQILGIPIGLIIFISIGLTMMVIFIIIEFLRSYPT